MTNGLFIITGLGIGGAEMMLYRLLSRMDTCKYKFTVISLHGPGLIEESLAKLGIPVHRLDWRSTLGTPRALSRLTSLIKRVQPDFVQGWMIHANLAALAKYLVCKPQVPILWNIRHSLHKNQGEKRSTDLLCRFLVHVSSWPQRIIYNSRISAQQHERLGYDARRTVVIPNGFDCEVFRPRQECRSLVRASLGLSNHVPLIGLFARVHEAKDHGTFLQAARRLVSRGSRAHFLMVGKDTDSAHMAGRIEALELQSRVVALGERPDLIELVASLDVAVSSSRAEAFPNAIGEAMACGIPCVVTDVGDSALLVGTSGRVVPHSNSRALSEALQELLELAPEQRRDLGNAARNRILGNFSLNQIVARYEQLYSEVVHG